MPEFNVISNVALEDPLKFVLALSKLASTATGLPEALLQARFTHERNMVFAGSNEPAYSVEVKLLTTAKDTSEKIFHELTPFLVEELKVPSDRGFIMVIGPGAEHIGFRGQSVATLRKAMAEAEAASRNAGQ